MIIKNKKGFTLIEIMVVIILLGILYNALMFSGGFAMKKASEASTRVDIGIYEIAIRDIVDEYELHNIDELCKYINESVDGQFRVRVEGNYLESIGRTDKDGNRYKIYTQNYSDYSIECGELTYLVSI